LGSVAVRAAPPRIRFVPGPRTHSAPLSPEPAMRPDPWQVRVGVYPTVRDTVGLLLGSRPGEAKGSLQACLTPPWYICRRNIYTRCVMCRCSCSRCNCRCCWRGTQPAPSRTASPRRARRGSPFLSAVVQPLVIPRRSLRNHRWLVVVSVRSRCIRRRQTLGTGPCIRRS
jgi:hypothetical protein